MLIQKGGAAAAVMESGRMLLELGQDPFCVPQELSNFWGILEKSGSFVGSLLMGCWKGLQKRFVVEGFNSLVG